MERYIPFLISKDNEAAITPQMELASAFIYFEENKSDSLKGLLTKQSGDKIMWVSRGYYPLKAVLFNDEERLYSIFDSLGIAADVKLDCSPDFNMDGEMETIQSMDFKGVVDELKRLSSAIKKKAKTSVDAGPIIAGFKGIGKALMGKSADALMDITANLRGHGTSVNIDISAIKDIIQRIERSVEHEIAVVKLLCGMSEYNFESISAEQNRVYEEYIERINTANREIGENIAKLIVERQNRVRDIEKIFLEKKLSAAKEYILNKNKYEIANIDGDNIESDIYLRSMRGADDKVKQLVREENEEIKKIEKKYDIQMENEKKKLEQAVLERDKIVKELEDKYNGIQNAVDELKKTLVEDISLRRNQAEKIKGWFDKLEGTDGYEVVDIFVPFYIAEYGNSSTRHKIFGPHMLEEKNQIMSLLSGITGKVPLPFGERVDFFKHLFEKLQNCIDMHGGDIVEFLSGRNLLAMDNTMTMVEDGLKQLVAGGYISDRNYERIAADIRAMFPGQPG